MKNKASVLSFIPVTDEHFERSKHVFWSIPKHFQPFVLVLVWNRLPRTQHPDSVYSRGCFLSINLTFVAVSVKTAAIFTLKAQSTCWLKHYATHTYFGEDLKKKKKKFLTWPAHNKHKEGKQPGTHRILLLLWSLGQRHKHTRYMSNTSPETWQMPKWNYSSCGLFFFFPTPSAAQVVVTPAFLPHHFPSAASHYLVFHREARQPGYSSECPQQQLCGRTVQVLVSNYTLTVAV